MSVSLMRQMFSLKCPRKVESEVYLGHIFEGMVGRLQRNNLGALGQQKTCILWGIILYHIHQCRNEKFYWCKGS